MVSDGGSGYLPVDPTSCNVQPFPANNRSTYQYVGVGFKLLDGSGNPFTNLLGSPASDPTAQPTVSVSLANGAITSVRLGQPFYCAVPKANPAAPYSLILDLPSRVTPSQMASLTTTPQTLVFNDFVDQHSFFTQRTVPGSSKPASSGVFIADGSFDALPLVASQRRDPLQSRVVFVDAQSDNINGADVYYLNAIQRNKTTQAWGPASAAIFIGAAAGRDQAADLRRRQRRSHPQRCGSCRLGGGARSPCAEQRQQ